MCGIFGIGFQKGNEVKKSQVLIVTAALFMLSEARGRDASGVALVSHNEILVAKNNITASEFIRTDQYTKSIISFAGKDDKTMIIGHCRAKTKGSPLNNDNNHPIITGKVIGVHNGVISNDDELFEVLKEEQGRNRLAQVDSEVIFALLDYFFGDSGREYNARRTITTVAGLLMGSYACAFVHASRPHVLWLFKGTPPCSIFHFYDDGLVIFASDGNGMKNIAESAKLGNYKRIEIDNFSLVGFDLENGQIQRDDITALKPTLDIS